MLSITPYQNPCDLVRMGKHGFDKWVIDLIDVLEKTAMLGLENRYLSL